MRHGWSLPFEPVDATLQAFLRTLERYAGQPARVSWEEGWGGLQWYWAKASTNAGKLVFVDWAPDLLTYSWGGSGGSPPQARDAFPLGYVPKELVFALRELQRLPERTPWPVTR